MKFRLLAGLAVGSLCHASSGQILSAAYTHDTEVTVMPARPDPIHFTYRLTVFSTCAAVRVQLSHPFDVPDPFDGKALHIALIAPGQDSADPLAPKASVCVMEEYAPKEGAPAPLPEAPPPSPSKTVMVIERVAAAESHYDGPCQYAFNDCDFHFRLVGGVEQSDLSAQSSTTNGFVELFLRDPVNMGWGSVWLRARFLGAPGADSKQNVVAAASDPTSSGTAFATNTSPVTTVNAVDYVIGLQHDWFRASEGRPGGGSFTVGVIAGFGATTTLPSTTATVAFVVPDFGTNECTQLQARFGSGNKNFYNPPLPGSNQITTTTNGMSSTAFYCVVQSTPSLTAGGSPVLTQIKDIAFSPQDRTSNLLKYGAGIRLTNRWHAAGTDRCSTAARDDHTGDRNYSNLRNGPCSRSIADFTLGQDQSITGGLFRHLVAKADLTVPIPHSGVYFFGSASIRLEKNVNTPPLILAPAHISTSASDTMGITIPSDSVFVLPLKQSDRDYYRIGLAIDLSRILPKLFAGQ